MSEEHSDVLKRLFAHEAQLGELKATTAQMDKKLDTLLVQTAKNSEEVAVSKFKVATLWSGAIAGLAALGHIVVQAISTKGH